MRTVRRKTRPLTTRPHVELKLGKGGQGSERRAGEVHVLDLRTAISLQVPAHHVPSSVNFVSQWSMGLFVFLLSLLNCLSLFGVL